MYQYSPHQFITSLILSRYVPLCRASHSSVTLISLLFFPRDLFTGQLLDFPQIAILWTFSSILKIIQNLIIKGTEYQRTFLFLFPCIMFVVQCNVEVINFLFYSFSDSYCFLNGFELSRNSKRKN